MAKKDRKSIEENTAQYETYFKEDLEAIEEELEKSKEYSAIIDSEIEKLSSPSLGANKGTQRYLIEHITNAVQLQTQRQGLRRDRFAIKKAIIDYAAKFADENESSDEGALIEKVNELLELDKKNKKEIKLTNTASDSDLDASIDEALNGEDL